MIRLQKKQSHFYKNIKRKQLDDTSPIFTDVLQTFYMADFYQVDSENQSK